MFASKYIALDICKYLRPRDIAALARVDRATNSIINQINTTFEAYNELVCEDISMIIGIVGRGWKYIDADIPPDYMYIKCGDNGISARSKHTGRIVLRYYDYAIHVFSVNGLVTKCMYDGMYHPTCTFLVSDAPTHFGNMFAFAAFHILYGHSHHLREDELRARACDRIYYSSEYSVFQEALDGILEI